MRVAVVSIASLIIAAFAACSSPSDSPPISDGQSDASTRSDAATDGGGPTAAETAAFNQLVSDTQGFLTSSKTPGASIAVVLHGKLAFAAGVGSKNKTNAPVTTSTLFRAASMSKMIVAATAMTLVDEGKLDLDAPITTYLPWFQLASGFDATKLTMNLLLSHSSGFPCDTIPQCGSLSSGTRKDFFTNNPQPLWAPPGAVFDYSNTGFTLAATVIEAAAGASEGSYEQLAHDRIFAPLGMTTATFDATAASAGDHATGYDLDANGNTVGTDEPNALDCALLNPPGGIEATATDYAHFAEMMLANGGSLLKASSAAAMEAPHISTRGFSSQEYGYGLLQQLAPYPDHASVWHDGSLPGYLSMLWMIPDSDFAVILFVNARGGGGVPEQIVGDALGLFIDEARSGVATTTPASAWSAYQGTYDDTHGLLGSGLSVSVAADGGAPALKFDAPNARDYSGNPAPASGTLTQAAIDQWIMPDGTLATFYPFADGGTGYFVTRKGVGVHE